MFKEIKGIAKSGPLDQIDNYLALLKITRNAKIDRSETCFCGLSRQTRDQYTEAAKRAAEAASKWF